MMLNRETLGGTVARFSFLVGTGLCAVLLSAPGAMAEDTGHQHEMGGHSMGHGQMGHPMGEHGQVGVPPAFREALAPVYREYFGLHKALSADDLSGAKSGFAKVGEALRAVDMKLLAGRDHEPWMEQAAIVKAEAGAGARASDLGEVRRRFAALSDSVISIDKRFGHSRGEKHFVVFCPMALNEKGASWLQASADVSNPYFDGEKEMRRCGEVGEELP